MKSVRTMAVAACLMAARGAWGLDYIVGADVSFAPQAEAAGTAFKEEARAKPVLQIFREHGYNWVRLRLFVDPKGAAGTRPARAERGLPNDLAYTVKAATDAKKLGYRILLDFHYADTWADPGKQPMPSAWKGQTHEELVKTVRGYTRQSLAAFAEAGAFPEMVQIGNEVTNGMLWPDGQVWREGKEIDGGWERFTDLLKAGRLGVEEAARAEKTVPLVMIHMDQGGNKARTKWFYDRLVEGGVKFEVIGLSYYPWWHGSLLDLRENLAFAAERYQKDVVVVETAYCWKPTEYRETAGPFAETPEGQRAFLAAVHQVVMETPNGRGRGVMWWEPAVPPRQRIAARGMFDAEGNALPVVGAMDAWTRGKAPQKE